MRFKTFFIFIFLVLNIVNISYVYSLSNKPNVIIVYMDETIDMGLEDLLGRAIDSVTSNTKAVIIILNTNGGYLDATEKIVDSILYSPVKTIIYIPVGGRAFSAGAYISMASEKLVMAPGSVIGSAEPRYIGGVGSDPKVVNAMAKWIESLARYRNRNETAAREMVTSNKDFTAEEALKYGIADYMASNLQEIIEREGLTRCEMRVFKTDVRSRFLSIVSDPFIVGILFFLASIMILIELTHPTYIGGLAAGASLILALLGAGMIGANTTAIILLILGIVAVLIEAKIGHGGSAVAGGILIIFAIMLLYQREYFIWTFDYTALFVGGVALIILIASITGFYLRKIREVLKKKRSILDLNLLIGKKGVAKTRITPSKPGVVLVMSDYWTAYSDEEIEEGEEIVVTRVEGLKVHVKKYKT